MLYGPYIKSLKGWDSNRDGLSTPTTTYHLDWDLWSLKIENLQESQPTFTTNEMKVFRKQLAIFT